MVIRAASPAIASANLTSAASLIRPAREYRASFMAALREFHADGHYLNWPPIHSEKDFAAFLRRAQQAYAAPTPGYVPERCFWLVDEGEICGVLHFRHPLNDALRQFGGHLGYTIRPSRRRRGYGTRILRLGLELVWRLQPALARVLLTCYDDNPASRRIIERNGGRLEDTIRLPAHHAAIHRYWIERPRT